jgi:predicted ATP-grasp superfamily ATP-dependent carboligase
VVLGAKTTTGNDAESIEDIAPGGDESQIVYRRS